jgi:hypothetical protein
MYAEAEPLNQDSVLVQTLWARLHKAHARRDQVRLSKSHLQAEVARLARAIDSDVAKIQSITSSR